MNKKTRNILSSALFIPLAFLFIIWLRAIVNPESSSLMGKNIIYIGYIITILGVPIGYLFSRGKSVKRKFKVWGLAILLLSAPLIYSFGFNLAFYEGDGFVAIGAWMVYFPTLFLIGLILLLIGFFKGDKAK